ncbi:carbamoyl phosphate synthase small subunit [Pediococcus stilesii]|uniref:Carbamoyl phosphate synthase small chain n=1 Tax=Pediococcus stilesii TaxID=331679 RepID=A0A5R9BYP1_9LACO|nr:carbamoyl phosphate synthase small subunit [Pediococcus stilesii]TLQ05757.1 carbamoyl phosphate synthase small subunit [Pediococcus stilesii]
MKRYLILEDGTTYEGTAIGAERESIGELVFNTGMSGYQESITDQSYNGEILMFTYPLIGNYGVNRDDLESAKSTCYGVVVHEVARRASNWQMNMTFEEFLVHQDIPGISGVDTRAITRRIREHGAMKAALVNTASDVEFEKLRQTPLKKNQIEESSTPGPYPNPANGRKVVVVDFGLKYSILREFARRDCNVMVLPFDTTAEEVLACNPDGVMFTNGPGDPESMNESVLQMIREVEEEVPVFGICMGHQLFALANGAKTTKMKFGHRGFNHPVRDLETGRIDMTSQNHGYAVERESVANTQLEITHEEINDGTVEGLRLKNHAAFSVQFHPDAAPGPHDADYLFDKFMTMIDDFKNKKEDK